MKVAIDLYPDGSVNVRSLDGTRDEGVANLQALLDSLRLDGVAFTQESEIEQHTHDERPEDPILADA